MSVLCRQPKTQVLVNLNSIVQQNNTSILNRLSSVPATGEARTYCRFVVNPQKLQAPGTLSPAAVYELYIILYV